ncbi:uncharacterized protein BHQ10_000716 [Talaromyces amestolkiae]|uniref:RelA/SpoT domain-containing protein n=1 Tax=Talaromyces amestolkiae TaxID=1196081 RepID=A0A364KMC8_TALAM|nr:uncharacterized protein BHQ10_000716 [Talaromyces amestolkiae]RAO64704.1 hypothetical protein BHQ10_000716 [Talaromyces amestolkiae]
MDYAEEIDNWEPFLKLFRLREETVANYTQEVQNRCSKALSASNIRHPPITSRIKSWESAKGSISRRNRERVRRRMRDLKESRDRRRDGYAHETESGEEIEPFKGPDEMFSALHDFGGVRISLYFPGDIEKVAGIIEEQFHVDREIPKGHGSQRCVGSLEERLESLNNPGRSTQDTVDDRALQRSVRTFTGYKATHFVVKLRYEHINEDRKVAWEDIVVEIQVGTLIMHAWSEIEHDMIYKPLDSQDGEVSEDEKRILDLINGIVLTGEVALRQLEASTAQRINKRAEVENAMASSQYELATWIEKHFNQHKMILIGPEWRYLEQLFAILKVTGTHKHSEVIKLVDDAAQQTLNRYYPTHKHSEVIKLVDDAAQQTLNCYYPTHKHSEVIKLVDDAAQKTLNRYYPTEQILSVLIRSPASSEWPPLLSNPVSESDFARNARLLALRLVHGMNLAIYFGVIDEILDVYSNSKFGLYTLDMHYRPSITSFLDILHPERPQYSDKETVMRIFNFCKEIIGNRRWALEKMVKVAMDLPMTHLVAGFAEGVSRTIPIPAIITRLLPLEQINEPQEDSEDPLGEMNETFGIIGLIDRFASSHGRRDDPIVREQPVDSTDNQSIQTRFFVPIMHSDDISFGHWKLRDQIVDIEKMNAEDINGFTKSPTKTRPRFEYSDGVLQLAYRLYSEEEWVRIREAWKLIKPLKRKRTTSVSSSSSERTFPIRTTSARELANKKRRVAEEKMKKKGKEISM